MTILSSSDLTIFQAVKQPEGTQLSRLVDTLNQEEPFGVKFRQDGENITMTLPNGVSLLNWIRRREEHIREVMRQNEAACQRTGQ